MISCKYTSVVVNNDFHYTENFVVFFRKRKKKRNYPDETSKAVVDGKFRYQMFHFLHGNYQKCNGHPPTCDMHTRELCKHTKNCY